MSEVREASGEALREREDAPGHPSVSALRSRYPDAFLRHEVFAGDEHVVWVRPGDVLEVLRWLKEDPDHLYNYLSDVTAVDFGGGRPIQVVYQLFSIPHRRVLRVKAELPLSELEIDSVVPLWKSADWLEREVYDMFGVVFRGHPDLRRILMPETYAEGHPLRKDFPLRGRFSREEQTRRALDQEPEDYYIPELWDEGREPQLVRWQETGGGVEPADVPPSLRAMARREAEEDEERPDTGSDPEGRE